MRKSGILLPVSSLPSKYGIGTFSKEAYAFVDFLAAAGQKLWQILPLGATGYGDSPYQSFSTFAGNPYYIDLEQLIEAGYLTRKECEECEFVGHEEYVDYERIYNFRFILLKKACERAFEQGLESKADYQAFIKENAWWLEDYALYMAVKNSFGGVCLSEWEEDIRLRKKAAVKEYTQKLAADLAYYRFEQYEFSVQWKALKTYANKKGIEIIGDIPIYVAFDSADTWAEPKLFQLDKNCVPTAVAGCPPDAFSETGQLWGNPLYDWEYHAKTGYDWWMKRIAHAYKLYDVVRIDHFRGFDEYWSIPYGDETAVNGKWCKGPGIDIFDTMKKKLGKKNIIAEDLGFLTPSVLKLVKKTGYPGMKVLQFAFGSDENNAYLPHNYINNCVVYTGTHDNDTTVGWYKSLSRKERKHVNTYLQIKRGQKNVEWTLIRAAISSVADTAIIPMQDYLGLGGSARINLPSTLGNNWKWRMKPGVCTVELAEKIKELCKLYGRV
ncbi:MAG: 4-alpha-glucanotransferase [Lachnospiraceae bacterium]|nr:4-alpha-glucanotransferase [Lachnospiraceae bacterium]